MKKLLFLLSLLVMVTTAAVVSCDKGDDLYKSRGVIYGIDPTMCACCGGWLIEIDNVRYRFEEIPENSGFTLISQSLPFAVRLDWQLVKDGCPSSMKWITIERIKKE
jgi:hypothetical protein